MMLGKGKYLNCIDPAFVSKYTIIWLLFFWFYFQKIKQIAQKVQIFYEGCVLGKCGGLVGASFWCV